METTPRSAGSGRSVRTTAVGRVGAAVTAVAIVMAAACSSGTANKSNQAGSDVGSNADFTNIVKPAGGDPRTGGRLTVGLEAETDGWNPTLNRWANSAFEVAMAVFDPLVVTGEDAKPHAYLAEKFTPSSDFRSWEMKLRTGVKFHDGDPLTAAAVVNFYDKFRASPLTGAAMKPIQSVTAIDDLTVRFDMNQPWSTFPSFLTTQAGVIPSPKSLENPEKAAREPVGTGPFVFKEWIPDRQLVVDKNPTYWRKDAQGRALPYLDGVTFRPNSDTPSRFADFQSGGIDLIITSRELTIQDLSRGGREGKWQVTRSTGDQDVNMLLVNTQQAPFDDLRVRQAVSHAIDRRAILGITGSSDDLLADNLYVKTSKWYNDVNYPGYDPEKARTLVNEVAAEKRGPVTFTLTSVADPDVLKAVQVIEQQLKSVGMNVTIDQTEQPTLIANAITGKFQIQTWRQFGVPDPDQNYTWWISSNAGQGASGDLALNMARNRDEQIDTALAKGRSTLDENIRKEAYKTIQQRQGALLPYIWLDHLRWTMGAANRLRNIEHLALPDGAKSIGLTAGFMPVTEMWIAE